MTKYHILLYLLPLICFFPLTYLYIFQYSVFSIFILQVNVIAVL